MSTIGLTMNSQSPLRTPMIGRISMFHRVSENIRRRVAELEVHAIEDLALGGVRHDEQRAELCPAAVERVARLRASTVNGAYQPSSNQSVTP